jgi:L-fuconolactonase
MTFDFVGSYLVHLKHIPYIMKKVPDLKIVIDHLAKPSIRDKKIEGWAEQMAVAAEFPNVYAKVSGLNTAADRKNWNAEDIKPYIDYILEKFGSNRLIFGSDWPVANLAGDYDKVWTETNKAIADYTKADIDAILGGTAAKFYKIDNNLNGGPYE